MAQILDNHKMGQRNVAADSGQHKEKGQWSSHGIAMLVYGISDTKTGLLSGDPETRGSWSDMVHGDMLARSRFSMLANKKTHMYVLVLIKASLEN